MVVAKAEVVVVIVACQSVHSGSVHSGSFHSGDNSRSYSDEDSYRSGSDDGGSSYDSREEDHRD